MIAKTTPSKNARESLLACFNLDRPRPTRSDVQRELLKPSKRPANKAFRTIEEAIKTYLKSMNEVSKAEPQAQNVFPAPEGKKIKYLEVVRELQDLLDWEEKGATVKKFDLFHEAVNEWEPDENGSKESSPSYVLVKALCLADPEAAFKKPEKGDKKKPKTDRRKVDPQIDDTPFVAAAESGAVELIEVMIEELLRFLEKDHPEEQDRNQKAQTQYHSVKTAFCIAAEKSQNRVLGLLLGRFSGLADGESIMATMKNDQNTALDAFKLILGNMNLTSDWAKKIWEEAVSEKLLGIIRYLLDKECKEREKFLTYENAKLVMEKGNKDMWKAFTPDDRKKLLNMEDKPKDLLHTAVKSYNTDIVEDIIKEFPSQAEVNIGSPDDPSYPIQRLTRTAPPSLPDDQKSSDNYKRIRSALLNAMICSTNEEMGIREIGSILRDSEVEADTICLHLSNIDTDEQNFSDYVQWLKDQDAKTGEIFRFESTLKYANFPNLDRHAFKHPVDVVASMRRDHTEIKTVIKWLRDRGVRQILNLSVLDRLFSPHSDTNVDDCVVNSAVRVLDWRKLDLYLGNMTKKGEHLQELHLYSSGNQSVHEQWYRELQKFPNLRKLGVYVVLDILSPERIGEVKKKLGEGLKEVQSKINKAREGSGAETLRYDLKEYRWVTDTRMKTFRNLADITTDVVGPNLAAFIGKYKSAMGQPGFVRTKVAVIDSGVVIVGGQAKGLNSSRTEEGKQRITKDNALEPIENTGPVKSQVGKTQQEEKRQPSSDDLARRIKGGKSFVYTGDNEEQVWWHASEPHGTQMARLICSIDPCCDLYVAKVAETRNSGIAADTVAQAIHWAIRQKVDVISLSLVAYTNTKKMRAAIIKASNQGIVVLSSTTDEGLVDKPSGAGNESVRDPKHALTVAACDRWGNLLDRSQKYDYDYRFIGHNVPVGQIPFLKSEDSVSGSSAANAIAAGTASLVIACHRLSGKVNVENKVWRRDLVIDRFNKMVEGPAELKYVVLENLCGRLKKLETMDFKWLVNEYFSGPK